VDTGNTANHPLHLNSILSHIGKAVAYSNTSEYNKC